MQKYLHSIQLFFYLALAMALPFQTEAIASDWVRAKIGVLISNEDQTRMAKSNDTLNSDSHLQIHIIPEKNCYIYLINSDDKHATWLNWGKDMEQVSQGEEKIFPSKISLYAQKGSGKNESFTIVCSPKKLLKMTVLFSQRSVPLIEWKSLENQLIENSRIPLGESLSKPFGIAGSVRAQKTVASIEDLKIYSGNSMIIKKYQFNVEK